MMSDTEEGSYQTQRTVSGAMGRRQREEWDEELERLRRLVRGLELEVRGRCRGGDRMTGNRRTGLGEIDMKRDPISLDLDCGEVIHIPWNPIDTEIVRTREGLDKIGTGFPPGNRGNAETVHTLEKIK